MFHLSMAMVVIWHHVLPLMMRHMRESMNVKSQVTDVKAPFLMVRTPVFFFWGGIITCSCCLFYAPCLHVPGDVLLMRGSGRISDIGNAGGFMGHVLVVLLGGRSWRLERGKGVRFSVDQWLVDGDIRWSWSCLKYNLKIVEETCYSTINTEAIHAPWVS